MPVLQPFSFSAGMDNIFRVEDLSPEVSPVDRTIQYTLVELMQLGHRKKIVQQLKPNRKIKDFRSQAL
jgi:hypothetical protein